MNRLEELRLEINECDKVIIAAMQRRLAAVKAVGDYKKRNQLPVYQPERERAIIDSIAAMVSEASNVEHITELYRFIMKQSRAIQLRQYAGNIVLIGFMASGKTTIGKALAEITGYAFADTDQKIEQKLRLTVSEIFFKDGEGVFRDYEREIIKQCCAIKRCIIACGGGVVLDWDNIERLREVGRIIWLKPGLDTIVKRLETDVNRPLAVDRSSEEIMKLMAARASKYEKAADITIDTDGKGTDEICAEILEKCLRQG